MKVTHPSSSRTGSDNGGIASLAAADIDGAWLRSPERRDFRACAILLLSSSATFICNSIGQDLNAITLNNNECLR